jgi:hypothetical protein
VVQDGIRYALAEADKKAIVRDAVLGFKFSHDLIPLSVLIYNTDFSKFHHYHGTGGDDCWGTVSVPKKWDGSVDQLVRLKHLLLGSLKTINASSLMDNGAGCGMPNIFDMRDRATKLGKEGVLRKRTRRAQDEPSPHTDEDGEAAPRWGIATGWAARTNRERRRT